MKLGINIRIDVKKIEKARLFEGKKGTYLDLNTFIDTEVQGEYGDNGFISQSVSKEEREQGVQTPILGNVTIFYNDSKQAQQQHAPSAPQAPAQAGMPEKDQDYYDDDIPF